MLEPRVVALLDILGFSELVFKSDFGELFEKYVEAIRAAIHATDPQIEYVLFSDTVVLVSPGEGSDDLLNLAEVVGTLSYELITEHALPMRGCIAHGHVSYSRVEKDVVIAGTPIVHAYRYEQLQKWVGVMIEPSTANTFALREKCDFGNVQDHKIIPQFKTHLKWKTCIQRCMTIPFPDDSQFDGFVVVPHCRTSIDSSHLLEDFERLKVAMDEQLLAAGNAEAQAKHRNASLFVSDLATRWRAIWQSQSFRDAMWETHEEREGTHIVSRTQRPPERALRVVQSSA